MKHSKWLACVFVYVLWGCGGSSDDGSVTVPNKLQRDAAVADGSSSGNAAKDGASNANGDCIAATPTYAGFAKDFFAQHCQVCHTESLMGSARLGAPPDVNFDSEDEIAFRQDRIRVRAVKERSMPPGAPLGDCDASKLESYLDALGGAGACKPQCSGKDCGADGCGGSCGACPKGTACAASGACVDVACQSMCVGIACGDDGCGGSCGTCGPGLGCNTQGQCQCAPQCDGKSCGDDGCGGSCGSCGANEVCGVDDQCTCVPSCADLVCGSDGCGGMCGSCSANDTCASDQMSCKACVPDCTGKACGDDGCGGFCPNTCTGTMQYCHYATGKCATGKCLAKCGTRECGYVDCAVCGSNAGACPAGKTCNADGMCVCEPDCAGRACGNDPVCGVSCGTCADGLSCSDGKCACTADCTGRECGSDGCGGTCGGNGGACPDGQSCSSGQCVAACVPDCSGKNCGDDGCGGSCGACGSGQSCSSGACVTATVTFANVYAIFQDRTCGRTGCHAGRTAAEGLDLSTSAKAQAGLVDVASTECTSKKRVLSGDATQSYLLNKLTGSGMCSGSQMPKGGTPLNNTELDTVRSWINGL
jgi:hypothetical protein